MIVKCFRIFPSLFHHTTVNSLISFNDTHYMSYISLHLTSCCCCFRFYDIILRINYFINKSGTPTTHLFKGCFFKYKCAFLIYVHKQFLNENGTCVRNFKLFLKKLFSFFLAWVKSNRFVF